MVEGMRASRALHHRPSSLPELRVYLRPGSLPGGCLPFAHRRHPHSLSTPVVRLSRVTRESQGQGRPFSVSSHPIATQALPPTRASVREGCYCSWDPSGTSGRWEWRGRRRRRGGGRQNHHSEARSNEARADRRTGKLYLQRRPSWVRRYLVAIMMTPRATEQ